jgi:hypothetical protein
LEIEVFDEEGVGSESIGPVDVANLIRRGKDYDGQGSKAVVLPDPREDVEAVFAREFEVQEDEDRKREFCSVGELSFAIEVGHGVFGRADVLNRVLEGGLLKGALHEEDVVLPVFNNQYEVGIWHTNYTAMM